ncbi:MAG: ABC transporter ATP-binding protein [Cenarchaeum symbiont of Oopsacas minuta]|nr:ABC transporter ATP-binding protein [Cenarchaeum symbiont of Oopsacas minuta]
MYAVETNSLTKIYGNSAALDSVSLNVQEGEIYGFLGPNGAGKSTTMMILTTLLKPTSGTALVCGSDVVSDASKVRRSIGCVQQDTVADEFLTGRENLYLQARLCHIPSGEARRRIDEILSMIELEDRQNDAVLTYSGGMRKRLDIASGLLHMPRVLFLDEPTVGLDTQTRRRIWEYIRRIHGEYGMSVFLTTHYMDEADQLCGRVAIIDKGTIQAVDSPSSMKKALGGEVIRISVGSGADDLAKKLVGSDYVSEIASITGGEIKLYVSDGVNAARDVIRICGESSVEMLSLSVGQQTLDDVFVSYTGRDLRDSGGFDRKKEKRKMRKMRL